MASNSPKPQVGPRQRPFSLTLCRFLAQLWVSAPSGRVEGGRRGSMKTWHKILIACGVFLLILAAFTAFILPGIVKSRAIRAVEEATGRKLAIGDVSINPVTWNAEVRGVRLTERDGTTTFASFSSARVSVSPSSIFRGAPIVSEARLRSPYVHIVRTGANTYNFSDLLEKKGPEKPEPSKERARFAVSNIVVANGAIDFIDRGLAAEKRHRVSGLELGVPFVSTIPHYADSYIAPGSGRW
ncbi:AsmA family protein [bacterium]|nr:AsmA family protein [bacterium]